jgi:preprotein translocase subunit SecA
MLGLGKIAKKVFGTPNDRRLREAQTAVDSINSLEEKFSILSDGEISAKTNEFKKRLGEGEAIDALLPGGFCKLPRSRKAGSRAASF